VRLGREFDALRVAFSLGTFFWRSKRKYLACGARPAKLNAVGLDENRLAIAK
jgi:hypothetical protein